MQEPSEDKDEELCKKINEYLNNPPLPGSRSVSSTSSNAGHSGLGADPNSLGGMAELGSLGESDLHNLINNMNSQQLMQVLGMQNASSLLNMDVGSLGTRNRSSGLSNQSSTRNETETAPGTSGLGSSQAPAATTIKLSDLQSIISGLTVPPEEQKDNDVKGILKLKMLAINVTKLFFLLSFSLFTFSNQLRSFTSATNERAVYEWRTRASTIN